MLFDGSLKIAKTVYKHTFFAELSSKPAESRTQEGVLVTEVDLNQVRQIRDFWTLRMTARLDMYRDLFNKVCEPDFKPDIIKG